MVLNIIIVIFSYVILYYPTIIMFIYKFYYIYIRNMYVLTEFIPAILFLIEKVPKTLFLCNFCTS